MSSNNSEGMFEELPIPASDETQPNIDTTEYLRINDFHEAYSDILALESGIHEPINQEQVEPSISKLNKYAEGEFILDKDEDQEFAGFLSAQAATAISVYEAKTSGDPFGNDYAISSVESQFDNFAKSDDKQGMFRSIRRLSWLTESTSPSIAKTAKNILKEKQDILDGHFLRERAIKDSTTKIAGSSIIYPLIIGGVLCIGLTVGGVVLLTLPRAGGSGGSELQDMLANGFGQQTETATATATLPMTPTQWFPTEWATTQFMPPTDTPQPTETATPTSTPEPPTATEDNRPFFEQQELRLVEDYLEHATPHAGVITKLTPREDKALREQILPFLPEFVRKDNITNPDTNEGTLTYVYSLGLTNVFALREDKGLENYKTRLNVVRYNLDTEKFELINKYFNPTEVTGLLSSKWEFRLTPGELKNNPDEDPYKYLYIALQLLEKDAKTVGLTDSDLSGIDPDKLRALLARTVGIEPFRLTTFLGKAATPAKAPTATAGATQGVPTQGPGQQPTQGPVPTIRPTDIPIPTTQPNTPEPTVRPTDIPIPLVVEDSDLFEGERYFRIRVDDVPLNLLPLFAAYRSINREILISEKDFNNITANLGR